MNPRPSPVISERRNRRAFTLLELIVVLAVLGLLAAIAIPTYRNVVDAAQDRVTLASASAVARGASANAAVEGRSYFTAADLETAGEEVGELEAAGVPGELAADPNWVMSLDPEGYSAAFGQLHAGVSADARLAGVAAKSPTGRCTFARNSPGGQVEAWISSADIGEACRAESAIAGLEHPDDGDGAGPPETPEGAPGAPLITFVEPGDEFFYVEWEPPVDEGTSEVTEFTATVDGPNYDDVEYTLQRSAEHPTSFLWVEEGWAEWGTYDPDTFDFDMQSNDPDAPAVVNGETYTISITATNDAGTGPAAVETIVPNGTPSVQHEPDPPSFTTETTGFSGPSGSEVSWIDTTWAPPAYTGTSPILHHELLISGPSLYQQVFVPAGEPLHARIEGTTLTFGAAGERQVVVAVQPNASYTLELRAQNEEYFMSSSVYAVINTGTLPAPGDLTGATDGGWPAAQQVIVYPRSDTSYMWRAFRLGGGVPGVRVTDVEWSFDAGLTWQGEGALSGIVREPWEDLPAYHYNPEQNGGPYHLHVSNTFECGTPEGLSYAPQTWSVHSAYVNPYDFEHGYGMLGTITDKGNGRIDITRVDEPYPVNSANGETRQRIRYTYDTLSGPGQGQGTAIVIHHTSRPLTANTAVSQFPAVTCP